MKVGKYVLKKCLWSRYALSLKQHVHFVGLSNVCPLLSSKTNFILCRNMIKKLKAVPGDCYPEKMHPIFLFSLQFLIYICVTTVMENLIL